MTGEKLKSVGEAVMGKLMLSGGLGAGFAITYYAIDILRSEPRFALETLSQWGPYFALSVMVLVIADRRSGQAIEIARTNSDAMHSIAQAMDRIATRDDQREREHELLLDHLNTTNGKIFDELQEIARTIERRGRSRKKEEEAQA
ncbi:MAG: hypothetical protein ACRD2R_03540 [Terriglobales bacterium]